MAVITHLDGSMEGYDPALIPALLAELDTADTDEEHGACVSVHDESGWAVGAGPDGVVVWENLEEDDVPGPRHMSGLSRVDMTRLLHLIGEGNIGAIEASDWQPGYGSH